MQKATASLPLRPGIPCCQPFHNSCRTRLPYTASQGTAMRAGAHSPRPGAQGEVGFKDRGPGVRAKAHRVRWGLSRQQATSISSCALPSGVNSALKAFTATSWPCSKCHSQPRLPVSCTGGRATCPGGQLCPGALQQRYRCGALAACALHWGLVQRTALDASMAAGPPCGSIHSSPWLRMISIGSPMCRPQLLLCQQPDHTLNSADSAA